MRSGVSRTHSNSAESARYWIEKLQLQRHPEGGFFRQTYRGDLTIAQSALPVSFRGDRSVSTAIYFLLEGEDFSAFHRIASDEMWHFYAGGALRIYMIGNGGEQTLIKLGPDAEEGEVFQAVVPAGCWFASCLQERATFALVGCTVAPGFDFADFEMADRPALIAEYPQHESLIQRLTRSSE